MKFGYLTFLVLFLLFGIESLSSPKLNEKYEYYNIYGDRAGKLREEMDKKSSARSGGQTYDAHTEWYVSWNFKYKKANNFYKITSITTDIDIDYYMPRWKNSYRGSAELRQRWDKYMRALAEHERGHKDLGVKAAREIESKIFRIKPQKSSNQLEKNANDLCQSIIAKYNQLEVDYDFRTKHGETQGAVFE